MPQMIKINPQKPEKKVLQKAAEIIKRGGLVAFPTETVYGLGGNALDKRAVRKIFEVKGRPLDNPVIVHIAEIEDLNLLAKNIPKEAEILAKKFWPGPLTLILFKKKIVPDEVTAEGNTVAIRMPKNKIALKLIKAAGVPIAAPSANLARRPSPTTAQHVFEDLGEKVDLILDGGRTKIGLESTVVDLTVQPPQILRPGEVTFEELKKVLKNLKLHPFLLGEKLKDKVIKSPGMKYRHYAPKALLVLIEGNLKERVKKFKNLIDFYKKQKKMVGVMASQETKKFLKKGDMILVVGSRKNLKEISRNLFQTLRKFDKKKVDIILAETFPEKGIGFAIMHRLKKAARKGRKINLKTKL
jgi:L-threonylcarbamoyladenylate synthase